MARLGTFVPRLLALTLVWLLATAALTYAAAQRIQTPKTATTTAAAAPATPQTVVVPDVRQQAYVFAEGTLGDAGFAWKVVGSVEGYAANKVVAESPAPGTTLIDTGAPRITLRLARNDGSPELGQPQNVSPVAGTAVKYADLALAPARPQATTKAKVATKRVATKPAARPKPAVEPKSTVRHRSVASVSHPSAKAPAHRWPQHRPPAFVVSGARREPLDEMPLTNRAQMLLAWIKHGPRPTNANVRYWLYQHAWIVDGAEMGWWHGAEALRTLIAVDRHAWDLWGIGDRSAAQARAALAEVQARSR